MIIKIIKKLYRFGSRILNWLIKPPFILYYHRIDNVKHDPHLLSVTPENFEKQLLYLKNNFNIISLKELVSDIKDKKTKRRSVVITFDDGYADNLYKALPILEKLKIPATIFVISGKVNSMEPFYWDEQTDKIDRGRSLTKQELITLSQNPLIEIGAHTMNHPHLSTLSIMEQEYEISDSKKKLEDLLNKPITLFSYPFGGAEDFNNKTIEILKKTGLECSCTTIRGSIKNNTSTFLLPRKIVRNWNIKDFKLNIWK